MKGLSDTAMVRVLFQEGVEIHDIIKRLDGRKTYLQCVNNLTKGGIRVEGRIDRERPWTPDEDQILTLQHNRGRSHEQMRRRMLRHIEDIRGRLVVLGLETQETLEFTGTMALLELLSKPWGPATKRGPHYLGAPVC